MTNIPEKNKCVCDCNPHLSFCELYETPSTNYEQDHSHSHCYETQKGHTNHLRCCICYKEKPPTNSPDDVIEGIVKEFGIKFRDVKLDSLGVGQIWNEHNKEVILWIRQTLHSYGEKIREKAVEDTIKLKSAIWDPHADGFSEGKIEGRSEVLTQLEERIEDFRPIKPYPNWSNGYQKDLDTEDEATNKAISQILSIIKELKENV